MNREDLFEFFEDYCNQAGRLAEKKNSDYASFEKPFGNFEQMGEIGFITRMSDKFARLINVAKKGTAAVSDETLDDTIMDLFNYCWLLAAWRQQREDNDETIG